MSNIINVSDPDDFMAVVSALNEAIGRWKDAGGDAAGLTSPYIAQDEKGRPVIVQDPRLVA